MQAQRTTWQSLLVALVCLLSVGLARADALADLEKARGYYEAGHYSEAAERFHTLLDPKGEAARQPALLETIRTYYTACLIALGRNAEADTQIEAILRANPSASPDPVVFPGAVLDRFADVRSRLRGELNAQARVKAAQEAEEKRRAEEARLREKRRLAELERLARQEVHVYHNSRWIAALPLGAGQFQNGQNAAGWLFLGSEVALATTAVVTSWMAQSLQTQGFDPDINQSALNDRVHTLTTVNRASWATLIAVAVGGVVHAQLTFVPETRVVKERAIPSTFAVAPVAEVEPRGAVLGLQGVF